MFWSTEKGSLIGSAPMLVIAKSISAVPFGSSFPVATTRSRRTGKPTEWPGRAEPGKGPRPRGGGEGWLVASMVSSYRDSPARIITEEKSPKHITNNFSRFICSSAKQGQSEERQATSQYRQSWRSVAARPCEKAKNTGRPRTVGVISPFYSLILIVSESPIISTRPPELLSQQGYIYAKGNGGDQN